jgi:hypothetical protein
MYSHQVPSGQSAENNAFEKSKAAADHDQIRRSENQGTDR